MKNIVDFKQGYTLAMENTLAHFQAAELIAEKNNYGIANSHLILASEEAIKAYMSYSKFYEPEMVIKDFESYFSNHKLKHKAIKDISFFKNFMIEIMKVTIKPMKQLAKEKKWDFTDDELLAKRKEGVEDLIKWLGTIPDIDHNEQWWNEANTNKNNGFYVNVINNRWQFPNQITKEDYEKSHKIVSEIIELVQILPQIETDIEMQEQYQKIKEIQEGK
jgi:AbiV family abortive infection protein